MSKVAKGIGKVFKKVGKLVKKVAKPLAIAAAVYFTAGAALSMFPATAGFASSMPGFGATGIFSKAANFVGLGKFAAEGSGIAAMHAANTAAATAATGNLAVQAAGEGSTLAGSAGTATGNAAGSAILGGEAAAGSAAVAEGTAGFGVLQGAQNTIPGVGASSGMAKAATEAGSKFLSQKVVEEGAKSGIGSFFSDMSMGKAFFIKSILDVGAGLTAPSLDDQARAAKRFRGAFFGMGEGGETTDLSSAHRGVLEEEGWVPQEPSGSSVMAEAGPEGGAPGKAFIPGTPGVDTPGPGQPTPVPDYRGGKAMAGNAMAEAPLEPGQGQGSGFIKRGLRTGDYMPYG